MRSALLFIKKYCYIVLFAAFAFLIGRAVFSVGLQGEDYLIAVNAASSFSDAILCGTQYLSEGIVGATLHALLITLPTVVSQIVSFLFILFTVILTAAIAAGRKEETNKVDRDRFRPALIFASALFAALDLSVLRFAVFSIGGTVQYVIPAALGLLFWYISERSDIDRWLPLIALLASLTSYQTALAVEALALFILIRKVREKGLRAFHVVLAAVPLSAFLAHVAGNIPKFPRGLSRLAALKSFVVSALGHGGFFLALILLLIFTVFYTLRHDLLENKASRRLPQRVFSIILLVFAAISVIVLVLYSPIVAFVAVPGFVAVPILAVTLALIAVRFVFSFVSGEDTALAPFAAASLAALAVTFTTYTFGGRGSYIPLVLFGVMLAKMFLSVWSDRLAAALACAAAACLIAYANLSGANFIAACAVILAVGLIQLSPFFRKLRFCEILALCFAFLVLFTVGRGYSRLSEVRSQNEKTIESFRTAPGDVLTLCAPEDAKYGFPDSLLGEEGIYFFRRYYGIANEVPLEFVVSEPGE